MNAVLFEAAAPFCGRGRKGMNDTSTCERACWEPFAGHKMKNRVLIPFRGLMIMHNCSAFGLMVLALTTTGRPSLHTRER